MKKKILILGSSGMIGNTFLRFFNQKSELIVIATVRSIVSMKTLPNLYKYNLISNVDLKNMEHLQKLFELEKPHVVINCAGLIKQSEEAGDHVKMIYINSLFPHHLANLSLKYNFRLIHLSTDCVFSGSKGNYSENDCTDALDLYGRSKSLGEVYYPNTITIRTSLIGHELNSSRGLLGWFLSQSGDIEGYKKAIFSGLTTFEIAQIIYKYLLQNTNLKGLYHISADPINKHDLLLLIKDVYDKTINVIPEDTKVVVDRSLDSTRFRKATGFLPKPWPLMIKEMSNFR